MVVGCGGGPVAVAKPASNVVPVVGTLTYQGKPLELYMVSFQPVDEGGYSAVGTTDSSGNFILGTNKPNDGAKVGKYKVAITYAGPPSDVDLALQEPGDIVPPKRAKTFVQLPQKYGKADTSFIQIEVPAGGLPDCKIDLK